MSLKYFHLLFITLSALLAFLFAALEYSNHREFGGSHLDIAICALTVCIALICYGIWFFKKSRRLIL